MNKKQTLMTALLGAALMFGTIGAANATPWTKDHPRRTEVNHRLTRQDMRINHDLRTGKITFRQARKLHREDHLIRANERLDARFDRTHVTPTEKHALNQDENGVNRQIHQDVH